PREKHPQVARGRRTARNLRDETEDRRQVGMRSVLAVDADTGGHDRVRAVDQTLCRRPGRIRVDRGMKRFPPGRIEVIDGLVAVELEAERVLGTAIEGRAV